MDDWLANIGWIALCLCVPVVWGVVVNKLFDIYSARRGAGRDTAPPEYHI